MKQAQTLQGQPIEASPQAPPEAICPYCGGRLQLRHRHAMNKRDIAYFWRHASNSQKRCAARFSPNRL